MMRPPISRAGTFACTGRGESICAVRVTNRFAPQSHWRKNINLILLWLSAAGFIVVAIMRITDPVLPVLASEFNLTIGNVSIIVTAFAVPYGIFQLAYGPLGDRFGKLKIIILTLAASSIFTTSCALATNIETLATLRLASGIATAAIVPLSMAFIADHYDYQVRQAVIARYLSGLIMGQIAGGCLGGILAEYFGWRVIFIVFGVACAVMAVCVWRYASHHREVLRPVPLSPRRIFLPYLELLRQSRPRQVITMALFEGMFIFGGTAFMGAFLRETFELNYGVVGGILACYGLGSLIYTYTATRIIAALGERGMVLAGSFTVAACYTVLGFAPTWFVCIPILLVAGFGFYVMHNTLQTLATELAPEARGTAVSLFAFALIGGQGFGAAILGPVIDRFGYTTAFIFIAVVAAVLGSWFQHKLKNTPVSATA